ncbi:succinyl-diaminopimelate desuccinylase [Fructobacillus ficulneus]|uniref:Succinyl-diaminopimelate desuccinylase n=1 Tax=Fructobacillus ficulneus TaxID=157463 RepID=A0A0K8MI60_9LACO|nr:succinyl-diaminopimelate desuccinylase [Fructobacillus ficulneus]
MNQNPVLLNGCQSDLGLFESLNKWRKQSFADVAELADALDLGSSGVIRAGSIPVIRIATFVENVVDISASI